MRALKGFCLGAGRDVNPGDVFEATAQQATEWEWLGFAERLGPAPQGGAA